jgi:ribosomal protein S18 acetylase RimI-like enzyme
MTHIVKADCFSHYQEISDLAVVIWSEHYTPIIGSDQVAYMLDKFQSIPAITEQIKKGNDYYLLFRNDKPSGYFCIYNTPDAVFISKLYILSQNRGQGLGKSVMNFIENKAVELGHFKISLTVNKYNYNSIEAYKKMGFHIIKSWVQDIGNNYIMDDYYLEKKITTNDAGIKL